MPEKGKIYPYFIYDNSGDFICQRKREALEKVKLSGGGTLENSNEFAPLENAYRFTLTVE